MPHAVLHEFSASLQDEVQLVLGVGLLRVRATRRVQLGAHTAVAQQLDKPLPGRAGQLFQSVVCRVFHRVWWVRYGPQWLQGALQSTMNSVAPWGDSERWGSALSATW